MRFWRGWGDGWSTTWIYMEYWSLDAVEMLVKAGTIVVCACVCHHIRISYYSKHIRFRCFASMWCERGREKMLATARQNCHFYRPHNLYKCFFRCILSTLFLLHCCFVLIYKVITLARSLLHRLCSFEFNELIDS